jgi:hypothetical protein
MPQQTTTPTPSNSSETSATNPSDPAEYRKMVEKVAEKVWAMWREELRRERERRGTETR